MKTLRTAALLTTLLAARALFADAPSTQPTDDEKMAAHMWTMPSNFPLSSGLKVGETIDLYTVREVGVWAFENVEVSYVDTVGLRFRRQYVYRTQLPSGLIQSETRTAEMWLPWTQVQSIDRIIAKTPTTAPAK